MRYQRPGTVSQRRGRNACGNDVGGAMEQHVQPSGTRPESDGNHPEHREHDRDPVLAHDEREARQDQH